MAEFVNLNDTNDTLNIIPYNPTALELITPTSEILDGQITSLDVPDYPTDPDVFTIDLIVPNSEEVQTIEPICVDDKCDVANYYGDTNPDGSFKRVNLFSELIDEYERAVARKNLGIADEYSLVWGYISGNILNQKDLYDFVMESNASKVNDLIEELNLKLAQWGYDIQNSLNNKAPIDSPTFTGSPQTTTPNYSDVSTRIPTTEWVVNKIGEIGIGSLNWFSLNQTYMFSDDPPITLVAQWDYNEPIEYQEINGQELNINLREYTLLNVSSNTSLTLKYRVSGSTFQKSILFEVFKPIYFGKIQNHIQLNKTKEKTININCSFGENAYLYIPNNGNARIAVDNIVGGFSNLGSQIISDTVYTIYKSVNSGLGQLYITIL